MNKRLSLWITGIAASLALLISLAFTPDYFEISKQLEIFNQIFKEVTLYYVDETQPGELMEEALVPMLSSLDPYTNYIPEEMVEDFRISNTGSYGGIGASIGKHKGKILITGPYKGFAAEKADLRTGDIIISVEGKSVEGKTTDEVSEILKGSPGSKVNLTIERQGQKLQKEIERENVHINSVDYAGMIDEKVGYINLRSFTANASKEIAKALKNLKTEHKLEGLVLDLRSNLGGLLSEAVNVSNLFIDKGQLVVETKGKLEEWHETYKTLGQPMDKQIPLVVLINRRSASASEIVAGTLQDYDRAVVLGQRSYGKGLVQQTRKLPYGSQLKVTIAKYYIPSGRCIQAINYAERNEDGSVKRIPDSLRIEYQTANGRKVLGGGGIDPDIKVTQETMGKIVVELIANLHIFDYATEYAYKHESIPPAKEFKLTDSDYQDFKNWLEGREYAYETDTEKALRKLRSTAEKEKYLQHIDKQISSLENAFNIHQNNDLEIYKKEITRFLEQEIASRYYFEEGRIANELSTDPEVEKALEVLHNQTSYQNTLSGN